MSGYLEITFGPMFSGKTNMLIDKVNRYVSVRKQQGKEPRVIVINHSSDIRKEGLTPHNNRDVNSDVISAVYLADVDVKNYDYIAVDESQFFIDLIPTILYWLSLGKHIHCSGLVADARMRKFGNLIDIIPIASHIEQLKAFCSVCGDKMLNAPFTRLVNVKELGDTNILVGAEEHYRAVCAKHHL